MNTVAYSDSEKPAKPKRLKPLKIKHSVKRALELERAYQERKFPGHVHDVPGWLLIIEEITLKTRSQWLKHGNEAALHEIRQLTATGIACMENCGALEREVR